MFGVLVIGAFMFGVLVLGGFMFVGPVVRFVRLWWARRVWCSVVVRCFFAGGSGHIGCLTEPGRAR